MPGHTDPAGATGRSLRHECDGGDDDEHGAFLTALLIGITGIVAAVRQKSLSVLWKLALCCIPNVIYLALLLVLR